MSLFAKMTERPWLEAQGGEHGAAIAYRPGVPAKTALLFFLAVVSVFFLLFCVTYVSRTQYGDFQPLAGAPWLPLERTALPWVNGLLLALASLSLQLASHFSHLSLSAEAAGKTQTGLWRRKGLHGSLALTGLFSLGFILGQLQLWQLLSLQGFVIDSNPANSYFYLLTALHGLHLLGGVLALLRLMFVFHRRRESDAFALGLRLCAWYWHYLLLVWLLLFALLSASADTYNLLAALCGL
jgi:cytochrome c oxidase subunit III